MKRIFSIATMFCLSAICCLPLLFPSSVCSAQLLQGQRPVRIGISEYPEYAFIDEHGQFSGCDVEYAHRIAEYANLKIEIVLIKDAETYFKSLDEGGVDMLFDAIKTDEREKKYLYSMNETGSTPMSIYVRKDDDRFEYGNSEQLHGLVFGSEKDSYVTKLFSDWCTEHGIQPKIIEFADSDAVNDALNKQQIDAGVYGTQGIDGYRTIMEFSPTPYYIILKKDSSALKHRIDDAMSRILSEDPLYKTKLIRKYVIGATANAMDAFTHAEKEYLALHPKVSVAVLQNDAPYFFLAPDGSQKGILPGFYQKIAALTGLSFTFELFPSQKEAVKAVAEGRSDILALYSDGIIAAHKDGLRLTSSYAVVNAVMLSRAGVSVDQVRQVVAKERSLMGIEKHLGNGVSVIMSKDAEDSFGLLRDGRVDAMVCGLPSASWILNQTTSSDYSISPLPSLDLEFCGAVAFGNGVLCSILNKAIKPMSNSFEGIVANSTMPENDWNTFIARIPSKWLSVFAITQMLMIIGLTLALIMLLRRQKEKSAIMAARANNERRELELASIEKNTDAKNQFFSTISHDMRTPLNAIIGFSELAKKAKDPAVLADYLTKITASGNLLLSLINDTLTLSKLNSGKLRLNLQPVDLTTLCDTIASPVRAFAEQKHIHFTVDNTACRRTILADQLNTEKIFLNLLSNAVKYTPEGGHVSFAICDLSDGKDSSCLSFSVSDDGIGISEEFLPHIYEPFVQENSSLTSASGTGLGLSIVSNLVGLMGGTIEVHSRQNEGTVFTVLLQFKNAPVKAALEEDNKVEPADLTGKRVLLCEDNALNVEIATALLKSRGMLVTSAANGQLGIQMFSKSSVHFFDAILMDLRMPVMDGYTATHMIRNLARPDAATIPILAMTADVFPEDIKKCREAGMNAHIAKPLVPEKVFQTLEEYCMH